MPLVKMIKSAMGSPSGTTVNLYNAGKEYNLGDSLADVFVNELKVAIFIVEEIEGEEGIETKSIPESPQKAVETAPFNKFTRKK